MDKEGRQIAPHRARPHIFLKRLAAESSGGVAALLAFAAIPLVVAIGLSVDGARGWLVKSRLGSAVDAAALAGGRVYASPTRDDEIRMFFKANFPDGFMDAVAEPVVITPDNANRRITVSARATVPTTFMRLVGVRSISVSTKTEVALESQNVEVSLVLDVTNSMAGQRIADLKDAANELVDIIVQDQQTPFYSKVALVPYSAAVNVGSYAEKVRGPVASGTCTTPTCQTYRFRRYSDNSWTEHNISTCVTERTGGHAYTDAPPSVAPVGKHYAPTSASCLSSTITPLTSDKILLRDRIDALVAGGSTGGQIGVAWGWYLLSPNFGYLWTNEESQPAAYGTERLMKVAIIMTDGEYNSVYYNGVIAKDSTSGSGSNRYKINNASHNGNSYAQAERLCTAMKAAGVTVYTVGLDVIDTPAARNLVEHCATSRGHVYLPSDGAELRQVFREIAMSVSKLRLSK